MVTLSEETLLKKISELSFEAVDSDDQQIHGIGTILYLLLGAAALGPEKLLEFEGMCQRFFKKNEPIDPKIFS